MAVISLDIINHTRLSCCLNVHDEEKRVGMLAIILFALKEKMHTIAQIF